MPHLKVAPFDTSKFEKAVLEYIDFRGVSSSGDEILGVNYQNEKFILSIKKREKEFLIKPDKITRPINLELIKKVLFKVSKDLNLKVINSNTKLSPNKPKIPSKHKKSIKDFIDVEFGFDEVSLEIGFGSGRHLLYSAKRSPKTLFIGVEIHTPSALQVLKQIKLQNIENIWIVNYDARLLLEILPSNLLSYIFIHFPVPWDKKPHRRVIDEKFLKEAIRVLKKSGKLELRTDSLNYYHYSLKIFSLPNRVEFKVEKNIDLEVVSKYEARWRREQKDIYTLTFINHIQSPPREPFCIFDFVGCKTLSKSKIKPQKEVFDRYFINIREVFRLVDRNGEVLKLSFGDFNRPEYKYLFISKDKIEYIPDIPVPTNHNCKSHQKVREILCQM